MRDEDRPPADNASADDDADDDAKSAAVDSDDSEITDAEEDDDDAPDDELDGADDANEQIALAAKNAGQRRSGARDRSVPMDAPWRAKK